MCGIVYKHNFDGSAVNNAILQQYDKQRSRGTQGFGLFDGKRLKLVRQAVEDNILSWLCKHNSNLILFHHRFPTSTVNVAQAAHPINTKRHFGNTQYIMVHNGIIRNAAELFVAHQELGINYRTLLTDLTFNDSEALLWDFALTMEGKQDKMKAYGDMAFICLKVVKGKLVNMYFGRNNRPLLLHRDKHTLELSSEGRGTAIKPGQLYSWHYDSKQLRKKPMEFMTWRPFVPGQYHGYGSSALPPAYTGWGDDDDEAYYYRNRRTYNTDNPLLASELPPTNPHDYPTSGFHQTADPEANWQRLRRKFGKPAATAIGTILEAKATGGGKYEVTASSQEIDVDAAMEHKQDFEPTSDEVQKLALEYLASAAGVFEVAYQALEFDYMEVMEIAVDNFQTIRERLKYEAAMEFLMSDPEYEDENSRSSIWSALCQPQLLLA